jgi:hypothetical protein
MKLVSLSSTYVSPVKVWDTLQVKASCQMKHPNYFDFLNLWSGLGHSVVWYMVMNVLEAGSGSVFTGSQLMGAVYPDQNLGTHH